ncbi:uncharacterized protein LOC132935315 [Metopolophium dirhodum]|uniref:uncharacterized protein LOC132935315 n=1 Tax=Metopolophium dirhodum TaxID=44670 RepID=UPI00298F5494|nr:uncharacterized protein LOC132935315 [Metopolophium dirhodum]
MHKCIVCGNRYDDTKINRPGVIYHGIPKDECMRRRWLKVYGIDRCFDWHRICSDHFLEENYKPGKKRFLFSNTIPQPYNRNGFPSKYATQSNGVETGNNVILPMEQNIIKEKHIGNAGVNNLKSPSLTRNNEDMSNKNLPNHTLRLGVRCSVKNCFNRLSKNLSLFGYPKDFKLRKTCTHFELDCFKNIKLKNRLKPDAVPSLYLDNAPPAALPVSIDKAPVLTSTCEVQFISQMDMEAAGLTSERKQNNVIAPPAALAVPIDEAPVLTSTCEVQFISQMDMEAAGLTSDGKQNNVIAPPTALPVSIDEAPVLTSTCEDQFISPIDSEAAEQTSEGKQNNVKDDTDNTPMIIDLTIDDSSNSSLSITLEPIEKRTSQCTTMDVCNTEDVHGLIFELSKEVVLPSLYWKSEHLNIENATRFYQQNANDVTVKKIHFYNNLVPTIQIYGKEYEYKTPITTIKELDDLLEKIDSIEKCYGRGGFVFEQCLGYFENSLVNMCSGCEGLIKDQDLERMKAKIEAKDKALESLRISIAEKQKMVLKLRKKMAETIRNRQLTTASNLSAGPSGISNITKP